MVMSIQISKNIACKDFGYRFSLLKLLYGLPFLMIGSGLLIILADLPFVPVQVAPGGAALIVIIAMGLLFFAGGLYMVRLAFTKIGIIIDRNAKKVIRWKSVFFIKKQEIYDLSDFNEITVRTLLNGRRTTHTILLSGKSELSLISEGKNSLAQIEADAEKLAEFLSMPLQRCEETLY